MNEQASPQRASQQRVVVIGGGPVGLAAAAHLLERGLEPLVLEAGPHVGASIREWGHVRLFSPWRYLIDRAAVALLERDGWQAPDPEEHPTGADLVRRYLEPLAAVPEIALGLRLEHRVTAVTRVGFDRMKSPGREDAPFLVVADGPLGEIRLLARAVIDASGTWTNPNPLGTEGIPAVGEKRVGQRVRYGIPDALGSERERYAGKRTLVVGSGHSAVNAVLELASLKREVAAGEVLWALRRTEPGTLFGGGSNDELPERAALGGRSRALVEAGEVVLFTGFRVERLEPAGIVAGPLRVVADDGRSLLVDEIVATTGFRPDLDMLRELRLDLDHTTESPARLAPLIDPNVHSCGTVPPHGEAELSQPESGFYLVGMKSYGRAPTFLLLTGYEQVRSVVAFLAGDLEAARQVQLTLPATGVCCGEGGCAVPSSGNGVEVVGAACGSSSAGSVRVAGSRDADSRETDSRETVTGAKQLTVVGGSSGCC